nr:PREDICTED: achaete-scute homolog 4 [Latimeria chalumnae]|eukprot:XP_014351415.1 PREDICTED: achaete-scute homolog 4 [Latimeria chalumnae]
MAFPLEGAGIPLHLEPVYLEEACSRGYSGRLSYLQLPGHLGLYDCSFEPAFIRKRNERERQRVRCVNQGYARLREHLPEEFAEKRLSKVETLRAAICYINRLQRLLELHSSRSAEESGLSPKEAAAAAAAAAKPRRGCSSDGDSKTSSTSSPFTEAEDLSS